MKLVNETKTSAYSANVPEIMTIDLQEPETFLPYIYEDNVNIIIAAGENWGVDWKTEQDIFLTNKAPRGRKKKLFSFLPTLYFFISGFFNAKKKGNVNEPEMVKDSSITQEMMALLGAFSHLAGRIHGARETTALKTSTVGYNFSASLIALIMLLERLLKQPEMVKDSSITQEMKRFLGAVILIYNALTITPEMVKDSSITQKLEMLLVAFRILFEQLENEPEMVKDSSITRKLDMLVTALHYIASKLNT